MRLFFRTILRFLQEADIFLLMLCLICSVYGVILVSSATSNLEGTSLSVQAGAIVIGVVLFVLFSYIDIDIIADKSALLFVLSMFFISTLIIWGAGATEVGESGWLRFWGIGIQPAEVVKVPFIIIMAKMISDHNERRTLSTFLTLAKIVFVCAMIIGLIIQVSGDVGNPLMYIMILLSMLFVGGLKIRWFLLGGALAAAVSPLIWNYFLSDLQRNRIQAPFWPDRIDPLRQGVLWQPDMSVRAISSGGFYGQGLGNGAITQSGTFPAQHTDFIFSAAGEELGFVGCMLVVILLTAIIVRCIYVGLKSNNSLGMLVCIGVAGVLIAQSLLNIGMCLGILPVVGITLPFFSYGGSSVVTFFAATGLVSGIKMRPKPTRSRSM